MHPSLMAGTRISYADLSQSFAIFADYPQDGKLIILPNAEPLGFRVIVGVHPEDVTRRDLRRLGELGWEPSATLPGHFDRLYTAV